MIKYTFNLLLYLFKLKFHTLHSSSDPYQQAADSAHAADKITWETAQIHTAALGIYH